MAEESSIVNSDAPSRAERWYAGGLRFTCTQCGNCCTGPPGYVWFSRREALAIAGHLNIDLETFLRRHAHTVNGRWTLNERRTEHGYDCVFLQRDEHGRALCGIYPVRPGQCRTWPFWPENLASARRWRQVARNCPGVARGIEGEGRLYPLEQVRIIRDSTPGDPSPDAD